MSLTAREPESKPASLFEAQAISGEMHGQCGRQCDRGHLPRHVSGTRQEAQSERGNDQRGGDGGDMKRHGCTLG